MEKPANEVIYDSHNTPFRYRIVKQYTAYNHSGGYWMFTLGTDRLQTNCLGEEVWVYAESAVTGQYLSRLLHGLEPMPERR